MDGDAVDARRTAWRTMTSVEQQENVRCHEQSATHATEHVAKAGTELRGIRDGTFAPMDTNLNPAASTGELKVFYCKAPMIQKVLKTVEFPQVQHVDEIVDEPVVMQGQVPTTQTVQKTVEASQVQFPDRVADVPVVSRRQVPGPLIQEEIVEVIRVVDSEDLPLNISGETLLQNKIMRVIKKNHVTKYLEMLAEIAELNDAYKKFYEQFVKCVKLGIHENSVDGVEIAELLRFNTSKPGDEQISLKEYVDRMKEGQNDIFYITDESIAVVLSYPFLENLRKKGLEMHYIVDPADEHTVQQVKEFDGKMLKSTTKEGLDLGEELKTESEPLKKLMNEVLGDRVEEMIVSNRMIDSLRVFMTSGHGLSANMERIMKAQAPRDDSMHLASGSQQQVEGGEWETVVGKRRKKGEREEKRGRQEKVGTLEGKRRRKRPGREKE